MGEIYEKEFYQAGRGRYFGWFFFLMGIAMFVVPLCYPSHKNWYVPLIFMGVGAATGLFGAYFAFTKAGVKLDPDRKKVRTWIKFIIHKEEVHSLGKFKRVCVAKEYSSSDDSIVIYYVVRLEGDKKNESLAGQYEDSAVMELGTAMAGLVGKKERMLRWANMNLLNLMQFGEKELEAARKEAAHIAALIDFPVVEDLDETD